MTTNPIHYGEPLTQARVVAILVHGRGANPQSMLPLAEAIQQPGAAFLLPGAPGSNAGGAAWYPYPFMAPLEQNEPQLSAALAALGSCLQQAAEAGFGSERVLLAGFSQGACLALEYAARNAQRYGGLAGLSGGLIGPPGTPRNYPGSLAGTPVFLGCAVPDAHIPLTRVEESRQVLEKLGGKVTTRIYPGMGHTVNEEELQLVKEMLASIAKT